MLTVHGEWVGHKVGLGVATTWSLEWSWGWATYGVFWLRLACVVYLGGWRSHNGAKLFAVNGC